MIWVGIFAAGYPTGVNNVDSSIWGQLLGVATFLPLGFLSGCVRVVGPEEAEPPEGAAGGRARWASTWPSTSRTSTCRRSPVAPRADRRARRDDVVGCRRGSAGEERARQGTRKGRGGGLDAADHRQRARLHHHTRSATARTTSPTSSCRTTSRTAPGSGRSCRARPTATDGTGAADALHDPDLGRHRRDGGRARRLGRLREPAPDRGRRGLRATSRRDGPAAAARRSPGDGSAR